jgi:murein DD-endopeptidase MepM/ murein hydrolase activator NlpD
MTKQPVFRNKLLKKSGFRYNLMTMRNRSPIEWIWGLLLCVTLLLTVAPFGRSFFPSIAPAPAALPHTLALTALVSLPEIPGVYENISKLNRVHVGQYTVKHGDTLTSVAKAHDSTANSLRSTNRLSSPYLAPGKTILVHNGKGMIHQVKEIHGKPETLRQISERYNQPVEKIALANRLPGVALLQPWVQPGDILFVPDATLRFVEYDFPVNWVRGKRFISSGYGMRRHPILRRRSFHKGWDMPRPYGTAVKASREGRVIFAGWQGGYGRLVIVKHAGGLRTWYGHLSKITVSAGDRVNKGQLIGHVGSSGLSTGPHLHFEVRDRFGNSLNPRKYLF